MKRVRTIAMAIAISALSVLIFACATAPVQTAVQVPNVTANVGEPVYLFHGGSKLAKDDFCVGSTAPVYRYEGRHSTIGSTGVVRHEVGKIKIVKDLGDYYAQGVVVEGSIRKGDLAVQEHSGCLIDVAEP